MSSSRNPTVSIGMPVFNGAEFLKRALDSLLAQTHNDFELIISDNASTDRTRDICEEYAAADSRIRYVRQSIQLGGAANFGWVLDEAVGEYFMWAAHDDLWDASWVAAVLEEAELHGCIAFGRLTVITHDGAPSGHIANGAQFSYTGSSWVRRMKFFSQPASAGKANPIYGLGPRILFSDGDMSVFKMDGGDMLFLYALLARAEIRSVHDVTFYKRLPKILAGSRGLPNRRFLGRAWGFLSDAFGSLHFGGYWALSTSLERVALLGLGPVSVSRTVASRVFHR